MNLINDHFQNFKRHNIPRAQLIIADIPYNVGTDAYGSNPQWWIDGDNSNGPSELAGRQFFDTDKDFRIMRPRLRNFGSLSRYRTIAYSQLPTIRMLAFNTWGEKFLRNTRLRYRP